MTVLSAERRDIDRVGNKRIMDVMGQRSGGHADGVRVEVAMTRRSAVRRFSGKGLDDGD